MAASTFFQYLVQNNPANFHVAILKTQVAKA